MQQIASRQQGNVVQIQVRCICTFDQKFMVFGFFFAFKVKNARIDSLGSRCVGMNRNPFYPNQLPDLVAQQCSFLRLILERWPKMYHCIRIEAHFCVLHELNLPSNDEGSGNQRQGKSKLENDQTFAQPFHPATTAFAG